MEVQPTRKQDHLPLEQILVDESKYQFRAAVNLEVAETYATLIAEGYKFPNIVLFDTKREDNKYVLVEGFQRFKAYQVNNYRKLHVDIIDGTEDEAVEFAMKSNSTHGLGYTQEDKRKILRYVFGHPKLKRLTDNSIAKRYGFSQGFVSSYRKKYEIERGIEDEDRVKIAKTKDGREYEIDTKKGGETRKKNGTDKNTRKKPVIPGKESIFLTEEMLHSQLELGENVSEILEVEIEDSNVVQVSLVQGSTYTNESETVKITFDELSKVSLLPDAYDLIIYSGDLNWLVDNQSFITSNPNVIVQGYTGADIGKVQDIENLANDFNLFLVGRRMIVTAYYCSKVVNIEDQIIASNEDYLLVLIQALAPEKTDSILLVDPSFNVVEIMQQFDRSVHVFYSERNYGLALKELNDCSLLEIGLRLVGEDETGHF